MPPAYCIEMGSSPTADIKKKESPKGLSFFLVPVTGLEPVRCRQRRILSPLRLPFHHTGRCLISIVQKQEKCKQKFPGKHKNP